MTGIRAEHLQPAAKNSPADKPIVPRISGITSAELFGNSRELRILHADEVYVLRQTSKGKLILTK